MLNADTEYHDLSSDSEFWEEFFEDEYLEDDPTVNVENRRRSPGLTARRGRSTQCLIECHICQTRLKTLDGYKNHLKAHRMKDLLQCKPAMEAFNLECQKETKRLLQEIAAVDTTHPHARDINCIVTSLLSVCSDSGECEFLSIVVEEILRVLCSIPAKTFTGFNTSFHKELYVLLGNLDLRRQLLEYLKESITCKCTDEAGHWVVGEICRSYAKILEAFFLKTMREQYECRLFEGTAPEAQGITRRIPVSSKLFITSVEVVFEVF